MQTNEAFLSQHVFQISIAFKKPSGAGTGPWADFWIVFLLGKPRVLCTDVIVTSVFFLIYSLMYFMLYGFERPRLWKFHPTAPAGYRQEAIWLTERTQDLFLSQWADFIYLFLFKHLQI